MTERELQQAVNEALRWSGWMLYHTHDSRRSQAGFPDIVAVKGARTIWAELKTEKGKLRQEQREWLDALVEAQPEVYLVRPAGLDAFIALLGDPVEGLSLHWNNVKERE